MAPMIRNRWWGQAIPQPQQVGDERLLILQFSNFCFEIHLLFFFFFFFGFPFQQNYRGEFKVLNYKRLKA